MFYADQTNYVALDDVIALIQGDKILDGYFLD